MKEIGLAALIEDRQEPGEKTALRRALPGTPSPALMPGSHPSYIHASPEFSRRDEEDGRTAGLPMQGA
jgi:hypothetical protein